MMQRMPRMLLRRSSSSPTPRFVITGALTQLSKGELPSIGVDASVTHAFSLADTRQFAALNGDSNPIHVDPTYTQSLGYEKPIVQGMLSASLFATIFGKTIPGAVYVAQSFRWRTPLLVDEPVIASIRVVKVRKRFIDCETICRKVDGNQEIVVDGQATVLLPANA